MPTSAPHGKIWTGQTIEKIKKIVKIRRVLDIGVGNGNYLEFFKKFMPDSYWIGIEVWKPYITQYQLESKYDLIINDDARIINLAISTDIVFAGDVLEHMTKDEAMSLTEKILRNNKCLIVSIPIVYMPQDEYEGNPYEIHVKPDWSDWEFHQTFGQYIVDHVTDDILGVYLMSIDAEFIEKYRSLA